MNRCHFHRVALWSLLLSIVVGLVVHRLLMVGSWMPGGLAAVLRLHNVAFIGLGVFTSLVARELVKHLIVLMGNFSLEIAL